MNIALFPSAFHPHFGGVEELVRQLALELTRRDHHVIVLTNRWPRNLPEYEELEGIPVYRLPFRTAEQSLKSKLSFRLTHERIVEKTSRILDRHGIDLLHVQCVSSNALYALRSRERQPRPLVVTLQGELTMDANRIFERSEGARAILRQALREADLVTGCSAKTIRDAEEFLGEPIPGARAIFNAANIDDFAKARRWVHPNPYIFALGRLVPQKGFDLLIEAFSEADLNGLDLVIAGEGQERGRLEDLIYRHNLVGRVHLVGRAARPQVASLFLGCSFFALPSRADEGLPVVCTEAMAAGKAIVAARAGGTPEAVLHGETGLIFEKEDRAGLVNGLRHLALNPIQRERFGAAGAKRAAQFSWPVVTDEYLRAYQDVMTGVSDPKAPAQPILAAHE